MSKSVNFRGEETSFKDDSNQFVTYQERISNFVKENDQIKKDLIYQKKQNFLKSASLKENEQDIKKILFELIKSQEVLVDFAERVHIVRDNKKNSSPSFEENARQIHEISESLIECEKDVDFLLMHLIQAQENLIELHLEKESYKNQFENFRDRWSRVEKYQPDYIDFGALELVKFDHVSDVPFIEWRLKDFERSGEKITNLVFRVALLDGHVGIGLIDLNNPENEFKYFSPSIIKISEEQLSRFLNLTTLESKQLDTLVLIFKEIENKNWFNFHFPQGFDLSFWRPIIKTLITHLERLPSVLRYNEVRLKRELINSDYEHLWLEFHGLNYGVSFWSKFEVRLGAALVQSDGFSRYPKFEIPLIDGKTKPFESWYAESHDDIGPKLELRFALDKKVFDTAVFTELSNYDRVLLVRLINAMPDALRRLQVNKTAIHRPWEQWIEFAQGAVDVLKTVRVASQALQSQAAVESAKLAMAQTAPPATTQDARALATTNSSQQQAAQVAGTSRLPNPVTSTGGLKIISVSSKVIASKPKAAQLRSVGHNKKKKKA